MAKCEQSLDGMFLIGFPTLYTIDCNIIFTIKFYVLAFGKRLHNYGKIHPFLMGKSTISMAIFNSYVTNYQRVNPISSHYSPLLIIKSP